MLLCKCRSIDESVPLTDAMKLAASSMPKYCQCVAIFQESLIKIKPFTSIILSMV